MPCVLANCSSTSAAGASDRSRHEQLVGAALEPLERVDAGELRGLDAVEDVDVGVDGLAVDLDLVDELRRERRGRRGRRRSRRPPRSGSGSKLSLVTIEVALEQAVERVVDGRPSCRRRRRRRRRRARGRPSAPTRWSPCGRGCASRSRARAGRACGTRARSASRRAPRAGARCGARSARRRRRRARRRRPSRPCGRSRGRRRTGPESSSASPPTETIAGDPGRQPAGAARGLGGARVSACDGRHAGGAQGGDERREQRHADADAERHGDRARRELHAAARDAEAGGVEQRAEQPARSRGRRAGRAPRRRAPRTSASPATAATIWRRVAPSARSSANSRVRCATVIEKVLKMMNAPTSSAAPASASSIGVRKPPIASLISSAVCWASAAPVLTSRSAVVTSRDARARAPRATRRPRRRRRRSITSPSRSNHSCICGSVAVIRRRAADASRRRRTRRCRRSSPARRRCGSRGRPAGRPAGPRPRRVLLMTPTSPGRGRLPAGDRLGRVERLADRGDDDARRVLGWRSARRRRRARRSRTSWPAARSTPGTARTCSHQRLGERPCAAEAGAELDLRLDDRRRRPGWRSARCPRTPCGSGPSGRRCRRSSRRRAGSRSRSGRTAACARAMPRRTSADHQSALRWSRIAVDAQSVAGRRRCARRPGRAGGRRSRRRRRRG